MNPNRIVPVLLFLFLAGCSFAKPFGSDSLSSNVVAGNGANFKGTGSLSVPTSTALVVRIQNGLENNAVSTAGNFKKVLTQVQGNLPKVTDPSKASGYDSVELLAYGACSDLTTGSAPKMKSVYNVDPNASIGNNQQALVAAGTRMLDRYVAGLASQGPSAADVQAVFQQLVGTMAGDTTNTSKIAFMSVCMAANTAGSTLMGF